MSVLVDTSVWSQALRRKTVTSHPLANALTELVNQSRVRIIGPIRQEILSGIRERHVFETLKQRLSVFPDESISTSDYERAAEFFNTCHTKEVQGSHIDFLICAVAQQRDWEVFTTDEDFKRYARFVDIKLYRM